MFLQSASNKAEDKNDKKHFDNAKFEESMSHHDSFAEGDEDISSFLTLSSKSVMR